jgi:SAM-dependent methyltransferase
MTSETDATIAALIEIHRGLERKGPGDTEFSLEILRALPPLPPSPRIADMGCGAGAGTLLLARHFQSRVTAVDFSAAFLQELDERANAEGLSHLVTTVQADMGALDWPSRSIDLLWSEGAAYALGFENALRQWRRLLSDGGIAVISEMTWFTTDPETRPREFWAEAYPAMGTETQNAERARQSGYELTGTRRLPAGAWWEHYYRPLRERLQQLDDSPVMRRVARETEEEMELFERFSDAYGYTFYVMRAV